MMIVAGSEYDPFPSTLMAYTLIVTPPIIAEEQWDEELVLTECRHTPFLQEVFRILSEPHLIPER